MLLMPGIPGLGATLESFRSFLVGCLYRGPAPARDNNEQLPNHVPSICQCLGHTRVLQRIMNLCTPLERPHPGNLDADLCTLEPVLHALAQACKGKRTFSKLEFMKIHNASFKLLPSWLQPMRPFFFVSRHGNLQKQNPARMQHHAHFLPMFGLLSALRDLGVQNLHHSAYRGDEDWSMWNIDRGTLYAKHENVISWIVKHGRAGFIKKNLSSGSNAIYPMPSPSRGSLQNCDQMRSAILHLTVATITCTRLAPFSDLCTKAASTQWHFTEGFRLLHAGIRHGQCLGAMGLLGSSPILEPLHQLESRMYNHVVFLTNLLLDHNSPQAIVSCVILEAGANNGESSVQLLQALSDGPCARVKNQGLYLHAFEPHPLAFRVLSERLAGHAANNSRLYPVALSDNDGEAELHVPDAPNQLSALVTSTMASLHLVKGLRKVLPQMSWVDQPTLNTKVVSASTWRRAHNVQRLDLLWLDMEGHELRALQSLLTARLLDTVQVVRCEVAIREPLWDGGFLLSDLIGFLDPLGFDLIFADNTPGLPLTDAIFRRAWRTR